ncbi:MAG: RNA polymerase sigma factor [Fibromonadaceae bacterium]|nr:RNA polymerase sigma factor [Fibromonadaceae bacterium]
MNISKLWTEHAAFVLMVCKRYAKCEEVAEDIRQDVFLKIMNSKKSFKEEAAVRTWLYSIAYHCCVDYFRKRKQQRNITKEYSHSVSFYTRDAEAPVWKVQMPSKIPCPLSQLMIELHFEEGWSKQEISNVFGFDMAHINRRLQRGLTNLQNFLN